MDKWEFESAVTRFILDDRRNMVEKCVSVF
jgi:hypothetical protein